MTESVEILMATYNGAKFLPEQIESLLSQSWQTWHLTVSDDASTDNTPNILEYYAQLYPNKIRRVIPCKKFGNARDHFFWLMAQCTAKYIMFCDQDDVWHPYKISVTMEAMRKAEEKSKPETPILIFTDLSPVDKTLRSIAPSLMEMQQQNPRATDYRSILYQNVVTGCTSAINRPLAQWANRCCAPEKTMMHDWWIALVAARFGRIVYIEQSTMKYRQHDDNSIGAQDVRSMMYIRYKVTHRSVYQVEKKGRKQQAIVFLFTFEDELSRKEKALLLAFSKPRSSLYFKISYLKWIATPSRKKGFLARW